MAAADGRAATMVDFLPACSAPTYWLVDFSPGRFRQVRVFTGIVGLAGSLPRGGLPKVSRTSGGHDERTAHRSGSSGRGAGVSAAASIAGAVPVDEGRCGDDAAGHG